MRFKSSLIAQNKYKNRRAIWKTAILKINQNFS